MYRRERLMAIKRLALPNRRETRSDLCQCRAIRGSAFCLRHYRGNRRERTSDARL